MLKCFSTDFGTYTCMLVNNIIFDNKPQLLIGKTHQIEKVSKIRNLWFFLVKEEIHPILLYMCYLTI